MRIGHMGGIKGNDAKMDENPRAMLAMPKRIFDLLKKMLNRITMWGWDAIDLITPWRVIGVFLTMFLLTEIWWQNTFPSELSPIDILANDSLPTSVVLIGHIIVFLFSWVVYSYTRQIRSTILVGAFFGYGLILLASAFSTYPPNRAIFSSGYFFFAIVPLLLSNIKLSLEKERWQPSLEKNISILQETIKNSYPEQPKDPEE